MDYYLLARILVSFLIGAIPFAVVAMWGTGIDITRVGSKNPGFNNVLRMGFKWRAVTTLLGDVSKGYMALWLLSRSEDSTWVLWTLGLASVIGHCWSPWLRFKGGKGVATTMGVLLFLEPRITVVCVVLYPLLRIFGRRIGWNQEAAIASLATVCAITVLVFGLKGIESGIFALIALVIIGLRHTSNLREILTSMKS